MQLNSITAINSEDCCGCGACKDICPKQCISTSTDKEGFLYPSIDAERCVECGLCLKSCPIVKQDKVLPLRTYAVKSKNIGIQYKSSSGGAFIILASFAIENGYKVYGATYSEDFTSVAHCSVKTKSELWKLSGSKYVQSDLKMTYKEVEEDLKSGVKVLYTGVGCQIQGLKNYLRKDYDNLLAIDILCHGVPSPKIFAEYINCISSKFGTIKSLNMKDKTNGWGHQSIKFVLENNESVPESFSELWNQIFASRVALRPSCHNCRFASLERCGDITIGDYWGIDIKYPYFFDKNGVSLLLLNNSKGEDIFNEVVNRFTFIETSLEDCVQPVLISPTPKADWRNNFFEIYNKLGFKEISYRFWGVLFQNAFKLKINRFLGKQLFR